MSRRCGAVADVVSVAGGGVDRWLMCWVWLGTWGLGFCGDEVRGDVGMQERRGASMGHVRGGCVRVGVH